MPPCLRRGAREADGETKYFGSPTPPGPMQDQSLGSVESSHYTSWKVSYWPAISSQPHGVLQRKGYWQSLLERTRHGACRSQHDLSDPAGDS